MVVALELLQATLTIVKTRNAAAKMRDVPVQTARDTSAMLASVQESLSTYPFVA